MKGSLNCQIAARLRKQYRSLKENGYNTGTFVRVQARNLGVTKEVVYQAATGRTYKSEGEQGD